MPRLLNMLFGRAALLQAPIDDSLDGAAHERQFDGSDPDDSDTPGANNDGSQKIGDAPPAAPAPAPAAPAPAPAAPPAGPGTEGVTGDDPDASTGSTTPDAETGAATVGTTGEPVLPPAYAVWKGRSRPAPVLETARPGRSGSKKAASETPRTSVESASSATRSANRRLVFARKLSLMTPAGRCVAKIRCRPSDRPR